jgi:hypothetical protein
MDPTTTPSNRSASRRKFMRVGAAVGAGALGAGLLGESMAFAQSSVPSQPTAGDIAILRFLAALETLEADLWQQYNELGGIQDSEVPGGSGNKAYTEALSKLDEDMNQYIHDNTDDEFSHANWINAYLKMKGADPVSLEAFRTLPSSQADGADKNAKRLTNLMMLTVDTSWWARYRSSSKNPDFGDTFPQAVPGLVNGIFLAIPATNADLAPADHLQAIANTAGFHFGFIEQGGTSVYSSLAQRVTSPEVLRILYSIGGSEIMHFQTWQDKAGNAPPVKDPKNGLVFPDLNSPPFDTETFQTNLITPSPPFSLARDCRRSRSFAPLRPRARRWAPPTL